MQNAINWFEIPSADYDRAIAFYNQIFQVELKRETHEDMKLAIFPHDAQSVGGAVVSQENMKPNKEGVMVYLNGGDDLGQVLNRVVEAGGAVVMPKTKLSDEIGHIGIFSDSEGNSVGLHSMG